MKEISPHLVKSFLFIQGARRWVSMNQISQATGNSYSAVKRHVREMIAAGLLRKADDLFPNTLYALIDDEQNELAARILAAKETLGM